jgi:gliotoxin/aspirochlorine biosynthesis thioredoxin reductase
LDFNAAVTLRKHQSQSRQLFDSGVYRSARTKHMHNVPTWGHRDPADFRTKFRADLLAQYDTILFRDTGVESVTKTPGGVFRAVDLQGDVWTGRKVVVVTGVTDVFP